jgi:hypothetical protein
MVNPGRPASTTETPAWEHLALRDVVSVVSPRAIAATLAMLASGTLPACGHGSPAREVRPWDSERTRVPDAVRILTDAEEAERAARRTEAERASDELERPECTPSDADEDGWSMCGACVEGSCGAEDACGYGSCGA